MGRPSSRTTETASAFPIDPAAWPAVVRELGISVQQAKIVELILRGMRDKQIAAELQLGVPTIRTYLCRIFSRLGVRDRVELVLRVFTVWRQIAERENRHQS